MTQIKVAVCGCTGRVGRRLCALLADHSDFRLVGAMARPDDPLLGRSLTDVDSLIPQTSIHVSPPDLNRLPELPDVLIDFSSPQGTVALAQQAAALHIPVVIGTTGLTPEQERIIQEVSGSTAVIHAMNYSLGVNLLARITHEVAKALGPEFDVEIVETHHNKKVDAPSGTALALADAVSSALNLTRQNLVQGRVGQVGQRTKKEIGMHAVRLGSVIGDHTVHFGSEFERIELTHRAQTRDVFAAGAIRAAAWLAGKPPGFYSMDDVLFGAGMKTKDDQP